MSTFDESSILMRIFGMHDMKIKIYIWKFKKKRKIQIRKLFYISNFPTIFMVIMKKPQQIVLVPDFFSNLFPSIFHSSYHPYKNHIKIH